MTGLAEMECPERPLPVPFGFTPSWRQTSRWRHPAVEFIFALCKASGCCSFMTASTAMSQDLSYRQKTERNRLTELIRVQLSKKTAVFL